MPNAGLQAGLDACGQHFSFNDSHLCRLYTLKHITEDTELRRLARAASLCQLTILLCTHDDPRGAEISRAHHAIESRKSCDIGGGLVQYRRGGLLDYYECAHHRGLEVCLICLRHLRVFHCMIQTLIP